jgi:hypothetical protein
METTKICNHCQKPKNKLDFHQYGHGTFSRTCIECRNKTDELRKSNRRECRRCFEAKNKSEFYYGHVCVTCYNKKRYAEKKDYILAKSKAYHQTEISHKKRMVYAAKRHAKEKNLPFNLQESDMVIPEFCPVLGIKIRFDNPFNDRDSSPSLDRLVPELGYTKSNTRIICDRANRIKSDGSIEEHQKIINYLKKELARK